MTMRVFFILPLLLFTLAAKTDPISSISEPTRTILKNGIDRYAKDEIAQDWGDLYEIADQNGAKSRDDRFTDSTAPLSREAFVQAIRQNVVNGGTPVVTSFQLTDVEPTADGYDIRACSAARRESFHFKGIIQFHAIIRDGVVRFAPWSYVLSMPHSCHQRDDQE